MKPRIRQAVERTQGRADGDHGAQLCARSEADRQEGMPCRLVLGSSSPPTQPNGTAPNEQTIGRFSFSPFFLLLTRARGRDPSTGSG